MTWRGYYINLDRAIKRRSSIEAQLDAKGLIRQYARFSAVDGRLLSTSSALTPGELGIYKSHVELIRRAASATHLTHVIEDDVLISGHVGPFMNAITTKNQEFDVIVTDTGFSLSKKRFDAFRLVLPEMDARGKSDIRLLNVTKSYLWGMTSYILSPSGARKFLLAAESEWKNGPRYPIDVVLQRAAHAGRIKIQCALPFLTWLDMENAQRTLSDRNQNLLSATVQQLIRHPFYIERDMATHVEELLHALMRAHEGPGAATQPGEVTSAVQWIAFLLSEGSSRKSERHDQPSGLAVPPS